MSSNGKRIANTAGGRDDIHVRCVTEQVREGVANDLMIFNEQYANHAGPRIAGFYCANSVRFTVSAIF